MDFFGPQLSTQRFFSPDSGPLHWVIKHILNTAKNESWVIQCGKFNKKCQFNFTEANSWGLDTVQITYIKYYWQNLSVLNSKNCIFFPVSYLARFCLQLTECHLQITYSLYITFELYLRTITLIQIDLEYL